MTETWPAIARLYLLATILAGVTVQTTGQSLEKGFKEPPDSAKPLVYWMWMNGNVTKAGITADLEWMKRAGVGGMQMFDSDYNTPQFVDKRLIWMTPEWKDALRHAAAEADRLGLEMGMAASGGGSETGGPWVTPRDAMTFIDYKPYKTAESPLMESGLLGPVRLFAEAMK